MAHAINAYGFNMNKIIAWHENFTVKILTFTEVKQLSTMVTVNGF